jgi:hypothetical protein
LFPVKKTAEKPGGFSFLKTSIIKKPLYECAINIRDTQEDLEIASFNIKRTIKNVKLETNLKHACEKTFEEIAWPVLDQIATFCR